MSCKLLQKRQRTRIGTRVRPAPTSEVTLTGAGRARKHPHGKSFPPCAPGWIPKVGCVKAAHVVNGGLYAGKVPRRFQEGADQNHCRGQAEG